MGSKPPGYTLSRKDNDGNYTPGNCCWASKIEQENNKRTNTKVIFNGETHTIAEWARIIGLKKNTLVGRISIHRWPIEKALQSKLY
jgi:hypothetical protein